MFAFAIVLLVLQSIGLLFGLVSCLTKKGIDDEEMFAECIMKIFQKAPAITFTILFICGVR